MMSAIPFTEKDLHELYLWVDDIPISRPKRNIARDFADGCCVAEIVKYFFPKLVELHNYVPAMSLAKKRDNWHTLNIHVFRKLYFEVPQVEIEDIIAAVPGAIERFLRALRIKIDQIKTQRDGLQGHYLPREPLQSEGYGRVSTAVIESGPKPGVKKATKKIYNNEASVPAAMRGQNGYSVVNEKDPTVNSAERGITVKDNNIQRLLDEKHRTILELRETVGILSEKIMKLEELLRVKDEKLAQYRAKLGRA